MRKILILTLTASLALGFSLFACSDGTGARIEVGQNVRNLCNFAVSGVENESRCSNDEACIQVDEYCWLAAPDGGTTCAIHAECDADMACYDGFCYPSCEADADCAEGGCVFNGDGTKACRGHGFCRQCSADGECDVGLSCDNGWCRAQCSTDADCDPGLFCTGGLCRPTHTTEFSFTNVGDRDLEIYSDQTIVRGDADAAVFCDLEWDSADATIVVAPDANAFLQVRFRAPEVGEYRAWIEVVSSDDTLSPLPLLLCAGAVAETCAVAYDGDCPDCPSCGEADFTGYSSKGSTCQ